MRIFGREFGGNKGESTKKEYEIGDRWYPDTTKDFILSQRETAYLNVLEPLLANNEKLAKISDKNLATLMEETQFFRNHPMTVQSAKGANGIYTKRYETLLEEQNRRQRPKK
jgi:hypothetical protein